MCLCVPQIHTKIKVFWFFFTALIWEQILKNIDFSLWGFPKLHFLENSKALCIWTPVFDMYNCSWRHLGRLFVFRHERLHPAQLFSFCILHIWYNIIIISFSRGKKSLFKLYSLDVYLSEFFKLSLVGLWLGEEDEWPKRYSCLESMVGFFGISVKDKKWIRFTKNWTIYRKKSVFWIKSATLLQYELLQEIGLQIRSWEKKDQKTVDF